MGSESVEAYSWSGSEFALRDQISDGYYSLREVLEFASCGFNLTVSEIRSALVNDPLVSCMYGRFRYCWPGSNSVLEILKLASNVGCEFNSILEFSSQNRRQLSKFGIFYWKELRAILSYMGMSTRDNCFIKSEVVQILDRILHKYGQKSMPGNPAAFCHDVLWEEEHGEFSGLSEQYKNEFGKLADYSNSPEWTVEELLEDSSRGRKCRRVFVSSLESSVGCKTFTIGYLRSHGISVTVCEQLSDAQLENILTSTRSLKWRSKGETPTLFSFIGDLTLSNIIEEVVGRTGSMDVYDVRSVLNEEYQMDVEESTIRKSISKSDLVFLRDIDKAYTKEGLRKAYDELLKDT